MSTTTSSTSTSTTSSTSTTGTTDASGVTHYLGLASGLDIDSIVKAMMTQDQGKLDKQNQLKQTLEWKQAAYQTLTTDLRTFESTYLTLTSSTSMLSSNTYCSYTGTTDKNILSVSGTSAASPGSHTVQIYQSAVTASVTGTAISPAITGTAGAAGADLSGTSFNINVDGVSKTISFDSGDTVSADTINAKLKAAYGTDSSGVCKVTASVDSTTGKVSIQSGTGYQSLITVSAVSSDDALIKMGIASGSSNRIDVGYSGSPTSPTLSALFGSAITADSNGDFTVQVNGNSITLNTGDNLSETFSKINSAKAGVAISYDSLSDKVKVISSTGGAAGTVELSDSAGFFNAVLGASGSRTTVNGRDAIVSVDGTKVMRSSNSFTVAGLSCTINGTVDPSGSPTTVNAMLTADTTDTVSSIQKFVNAYNSLITDINDQVLTKPDLNYSPLTDTQKASMSDDQITKWNEQAQKGVLFNDSALSDIVNSMRSMLDASVTTASGKTLTLSQIGITLGDYSEHGQLHVDETTLSQALENEPQDISDLFCKVSNTPYSPDGTDRTARTQSEGLCYRLQDIVNDAVGTSGSLIKLAGMPDESSATNNSIYEQLKDVNNTVSELTTQFDSDQTRYYNQFTKLETFMEEMNTQSNYITQMLSSSGSN